MTDTLRVARAAPDGSVFIFASVDSIAIAPAIQKEPLYDSLADFAHVAAVIEQPIALVTRKDLQVTTVVDFITYANANGQQTQYRSAGVGSISHRAWLS